MQGLRLNWRNSGRRWIDLLCGLLIAALRFVRFVAQFKFAEPRRGYEPRMPNHSVIWPYAAGADTPLPHHYFQRLNRVEPSGLPKCDRKVVHLEDGG